MVTSHSVDGFTEGLCKSGMLWQSAGISELLGLITAVCLA